MKDDEAIPTVSCACMSGSESRDTRDRTKKAYAATVISRTGVDQYAVQIFFGHA